MLDKRYQTLIILENTGSYTATAKQLFITQPAVSQQISSLETELHLHLVNNNGHRIELTEQGIKLAELAKQIDIETSKVIQTMQTNSDQNRLKMGCTLSLSTTLLPRFIQNLSSKFHILTSEINNTTHILQNIRDGRIDFGLIEGNFNKSEFDSIFLQNENFIGVSNPTLDFESKNIADLFDKNLYVREIGSGSREILEHWLGTQNFSINDFKHIIEIASPSVIVQLLQQSPGISFIYESLVETELNDGKLKRLDLNGFNISHPINLVFLKNSYFTDTYQQLADTVLNR